MLGYMTLGTNDLQRAVAFYDALFAEIGAARTFEFERGVAWGKDHGAGFGILTPFDQQAATVGNGAMAAIACASAQEVDRLYHKALALGGADEGAPAERWPGFYAAYFRDLDGNKLNGFWMQQPSQ